MRRTMCYAALLAALFLALGLVALPPAAVADGNEDVELLPSPGGDNGDPDSGGPGRYFIFNWRSVLGAPVRSLSSIRGALLTRTAPSRVAAPLKPRRTVLTRR